MKRVFHDITNVTRKNIKLTIHKSSHRKKLIKWLYEVVEDFEYSQVTFALGILILDKYTLNKGFDLSEYQLIGITVLFIAAKMEEPKSKAVKDYVEVTDKSIPHMYIRGWYLQEMDCKFSLIERQEILFCALALVMEKHTCRHNMYWMYLEGIREAEKILSGNALSEDIKFYLKHNKMIKNLKY